MKAIDADKLYISYCHSYEGNVSDGEMDRVAFKIASAPTITYADIVPHGRWIEKKRWSMGKWHKWLECSNCGHVDYDLDMYEDMPFTGPGNYCPNCGAKMDLEE